MTERVSGPLYRQSVTSLGQRLGDLRSEAELTLARLAGQAGMSTSYLSDIEHDRTVPTLDKLRAISLALGTTVHDLLEGVDHYS